MSFGFLGIQFGWGLQLANMSAVYERLGARPDQVPAALARRAADRPARAADHRRAERSHVGPARPASPVLPHGRHPRVDRAVRHADVEPVSGWRRACSGSSTRRSTSRWSRSAPSSPTSSPMSQRTQGFVMQSLFIGIGASLANALPWVFAKLGVTGNTASGIPLSVQYSFQVGAVVFLLAVLWTVFTTTRVSARGHGGVRARSPRASAASARCSREIAESLREMPATMRQLAVVQLLTWLGLFCMWLFFVPAVARHVFGATDPQSALYTRGIEWGGFTFAFYSITCFVVALGAAEARRARRVERPCTRPRSCCGGVGAAVACTLIHDPVPAAADHGRRRHRLGVDSLDAVRDSVDGAARRSAWACTWASSTSSS